MDYQINASSNHDIGAVLIKDSYVSFSTTTNTNSTLANPAELFLSAVAACILKNLERFSHLMKYRYEKATVDIKATRLEKPLHLDHLKYTLIIYSNDNNLNADLLKRNIEKFGSIYNTIKMSCRISGIIKVV